MSTTGRKPSTGRKSKVPPRKNAEAQRKLKGSPELRKAAEQNVSRAKALEALYRPFQEAAKAELQKTEPGRALFEEMNAVAKELGELSKSITAKKTTRAEVGLRVRERVKKFREQYGDQLQTAYAKHASLQPSVAAVAEILRPEIAAKTTWVTETSILGSMLLIPKKTPQDVGTVSQGLGGAPPPTVQSCVTPPYDLGGPDFESLNNATISHVEILAHKGGREAGPNATEQPRGVGLSRSLCRPAVGLRPCQRRVDAQNVSVTIPFTRDGSNGTVRIMAGADGQATVVALGGGSHFWASATIRQICLTSVG